MRKTPFAGLTELAPAEPLTIDGSSFQSRNPSIIDRFLEIGAVSHRHDARPALASPETPPSGSAYTSGGTLPADLALYVGYTLNDATGGETELSDVLVLTTDPAMEEPGDSPTAEIVYASGGDLQTAVYYYAVTLTDGEGGETPIGPYVDVERVPGEASAKVAISGLTAIATAASAAGWRLYRSKNGGEYHYLSSGATAVDNYTDDGTDCVDCVPPPAQNTTNQTNRVSVELPAAGAMPSGFTGINVYMSIDGGFLSPSLYAAMPSASAGASFEVTGLTLNEGSPPDVSTAVRGASQIDPDTELLDWHWKRPVAASGALASGEPGDVRVALDTGVVYLSSGAASAAGDWQVVGGQAVLTDGELVPIRELEFAASGGATVDVADDAGRVVVTIAATGGGGGGGSISEVSASGDGSVTSPSAITFRGSGTASASVVASGASAVVTFTTPAAPADERVVGQVAASASGAVAPASAVMFEGASGTRVDVRDEGGSAVVRIAASGLVGPEGPPGPPGADGADGVDGAPGAPGAAGSGQAFLRASAAVTASGLASGGSAAALAPLAPGYRLHRVTTSRAARVRLYGTPSHRDADAGRAIGTDPAGDHGLHYELVTTVADLDWTVAPIAHGASVEAPPSANIAMAVTNLDATGDVTVTFHYIPTEN